METDAKIKTLDELAAIIAELKRQGNKVVHCHGVFDLLHPGHVRHFEAARHHGDILVVTVTEDRYVAKGPGRPVFNERLRAESIAALACVDFVAVNNWRTAIETIKKLQPDIYCKGNDYANASQDLTGKIQDEEAAVASVGGSIHFTDELTMSSTSLLNAYFDVFPQETRTYLNEFREKYSSEDIIDKLQSLRGLKVLVIGDAIIDEYHYCTPLGKSPKENLIPAKYISEDSFAGGVMATANHIAGFCDRVDMITCLGEKDTREDFICKHLKPNVTPRFFFRPDTQTIVKRRFVEASLLRKLFEVHFMNGTMLPDEVSREVSEYLGGALGDYDLVVVNDFGHGFLDKAIIGALCEKARFLAVNAQTNSANIGFNLITKYPKTDYLCIDEPELRLATHDNLSPTDRLVSEVADTLGCHRAAITQGYRGSTIYDNSHGTFSIPVFSRDIVDTVGAGDAYLAVTSPCMAAGLPAEMAGFIGNAVGALAIRIVGNKTSVEPVELFKYVTTLLK